MSWLRRNRLRVIVAGLLVLAFFLFRAATKDARERNWLDRALLWLTAPVQHAVVWTCNAVATVWNDYVALVGVREENEALKRRLEQLNRSIDQLREQAAENRRLKRLLEMKTRNRAVRSLAARVIATSTSALSRIVRIDVGTSDGIGRGDTVVGARGLVGRVVSATSAWAEVRLISDPRSAVAAIDQRSRDQAIIRGNGKPNILDADYLLRSSDVAVGDMFVTSTAGGAFVPGIPVGEVVEVEKPRAGVFRQAVLKPLEKLDKLEEVLVMILPGRRAE